MTNPAYTTARPSSAGWYWLKLDGKPPVPVQVALDRNGNPEFERGERYTVIRDEPGILWSGPFFPPTV